MSDELIVALSPAITVISTVGGVLMEGVPAVIRAIDSMLKLQMGWFAPRGLELVAKAVESGVKNANKASEPLASMGELADFLNPGFHSNNSPMPVMPKANR
jgi:hypothetical protein